MKLIVAINKYGYIGKDNSIPWKSKLDMQHFKETTMNKTVIMGRKTWESLGSKSLSGRFNIVVSTTMNDTGDSRAIVCKSLTYALQYDDNAYLIGGESLYKQALEQNLVDEVIVSKIDDITLGDTAFDEYYDLVFKYGFHLSKKNVYYSHDIPKDPLEEIQYWRR